MGGVLSPPPYRPKRLVTINTTCWPSAKIFLYDATALFWFEEGEEKGASRRGRMREDEIRHHHSVLCGGKVVIVIVISNFCCERF